MGRMVIIPLQDIRLDVSPHSHEYRPLKVTSEDFLFGDERQTHHRHSHNMTVMPEGAPENDDADGSVLWFTAAAHDRLGVQHMHRIPFFAAMEGPIQLGPAERSFQWQEPTERERDRRVVEWGLVTQEQARIAAGLDPVTGRDLTPPEICMCLPCVRSRLVQPNRDERVVLLDRDALDTLSRLAPSRFPCTCEPCRRRSGDIEQRESRVYRTPRFTEPNDRRW